MKRRGLKKMNEKIIMSISLILFGLILITSTIYVSELPTTYYGENDSLNVHFYGGLFILGFFFTYVLLLWCVLSLLGVFKEDEKEIKVGKEM